MLNFSRFSRSQMLICVKSKINELVQLKTPLPDSNELISLNIEKSEPNGTDQESGLIKMVAKIFLNEYSSDSVDEAIENLLKNCSTTPSVILAYHQTHRREAEKFIWADNDSKSKENFKLLWEKLRIAQAAGRIGQLGIADMDLETILSIFDDEKFDFTILQINTQTCCVVPPELQQFCKDHEIQLLTHSDPQGKISSIFKFFIASTHFLSVIFPSSHLKEISLNESYKTKWTVRYLETLICRGILTKKGFIVNFRKSSN